MPTHAAIFVALTLLDPTVLPGQVSTTPCPCEGAKFHSPTPLLVHDVELPDGGTAKLCGSCRDNLAVLLALLADDPALAWNVRREFGNKLRSLIPEQRAADG